MRPLALSAHSEDSTLVAGVVLRMRAWLAVMAPFLFMRGKSVYARYPVLMQMPPASVDRKFALNTLRPRGGSAVIAFPLNGHSRLVRLAQRLRQPFIDAGLEDHYPLILRVSGGSRSRLSIDPAAYVEFRGAELGYIAVFNDAFEARVTLETTDFEAIERLVRTYISTRLSDSLNAKGAA